MADEVVITGGKLISGSVVDKINASIEKGKLSQVHAIVIHQTGGSTAESALSSYDAGVNGAHFLIDKDGTIYQTARIDQKCWHIGNVRSRCLEMKTCTPDELKKINALLFKKGESYATRIHNLHLYESGKTYPDRYPTNDDSIGIEIVGAFSAKSNAYEVVNKEQNRALVWLVEVLEANLTLGAGDVYAHGKIGYKQPDEGASAQWTKP